MAKSRGKPKRSKNNNNNNREGSVGGGNGGGSTTSLDGMRPHHGSVDGGGRRRDLGCVGGVSRDDLGGECGGLRFDVSAKGCGSRGEGGGLRHVGAGEYGGSNGDLGGGSGECDVAGEGGCLRRDLGEGGGSKPNDNTPPDSDGGRSTSSDESVKIHQAQQQMVALNDRIKSLIERKKFKRSSRSRLTHLDKNVLKEMLMLSVEMSKHGDIYRGKLGDRNMSIISPPPINIQNFLNLRNICLVQAFFPIELGRQFLVTEPLQSFCEWFEGRAMKYNGKKFDEGWLDYVMDDVDNAFSGAVYAWIYLNRKGYSVSGCFRKCLFVNDSGQGLMMPWGIKHGESHGNFLSLVQLLKQIVGPETHMFSSELSNVYQVSRNWRHVPDKLLFLHPLFFTNLQRVVFIQRIDWVMKFVKGFGPKMRQEIQAKAPTWREHVMYEPVFQDVYYHSDGFDPNRPFYFHCEIVRYVRNFITHGNHYVGWEQVLSDENLMDLILSKFPWLFSILFNALCAIYMKSNFNDVDVVKMWEIVFYELSKVYIFFDAPVQ